MEELSKPMIVVAGRSNVGKSSFINMILKRKSLARTSSTPGRTQLLNFFDVDDTLILADVPGYGFAKAPKEMVRKWTENVRGLVTGAPGIRGVIQLLDIRRDPSKEDLDFSRLVQKSGNPLVFIVTKSDKLSRSKRAGRVREIAAAVGVAVSEIIVSSIKGGEGVAQTWGTIFDLLEIEKEEG